MASKISWSVESVAETTRLLKVAELPSHHAWGEATRINELIKQRSMEAEAARAAEEEEARAAEAQDAARDGGRRRRRWLC